MTIRVVIVDDEPLARLAVKVRLARREAFTLVGEFGDGASAYKGIVTLRPDLVFVDVEMPGKSGLDVLTALPPAPLYAKAKFASVAQQTAAKNKIVAEWPSKVGA